MTIHEIYDLENISIRSCNVCNFNGLKNLYSILNYYQEHKTFKKLRRCGSKSNLELIQLSLKYKHLFSENEKTEQNKKNPQIHKISNLTRTQREIINSFIEINLNNLSNRSKNAITSFLNENLKIRNISEKILTNDQFKIQDIKNVGTKSKTELNNFIDSIKGFVEKVSRVENENVLIVLKNRFFIEKIFSISEIPDEILQPQSIFILIDFLFNQNESNKLSVVDSESILVDSESLIVDFEPHWQQREEEKKYSYNRGEINLIFSKNISLIFHRAFKIYNKQTQLTTDEIAKNLNISRERVRQLKKTCTEELFDKLQFVKNIDDDLFQKYCIDINQDFISIDEDLNNLINETNNTNFSNEFISYLMYVYLSDKFELIGNIEDVMQNKPSNIRNRHNWGRFYLVNRNLCDEFDFEEFTDDIYRRLSERIEENYNFNFNSYLMNFLKNGNASMLSIISPIAEKIINQEFGLCIDLNDNIAFKRNTIKQGYEYAFEALEILEKPSKVTTITETIKKLHPDYDTDEAKVRSSMKRINGFVPVGRSSIFGLKKWENEINDFKGGTIRQIVNEYLGNNSIPQHFSAITSYILQFRPKSNEYSIIQNLKLDESGMFVFFKNSLVGLSDKIYDDTYLLLADSNTIEKKSWEERYSDLLDFLTANNRLPFSSGCPNEEVRLYRWYRVQVGKYENGNLDELKGNFINNISNNFEQIEKSSIRKKTYNVDKYNILQQFVQESKRLPSANKTGEEILYHFFYKQRKLFEAGELEKYEEDNFIKIAQIIQKYKI